MFIIMTEKDAVEGYASMLTAHWYAKEEVIYKIN